MLPVKLLEQDLVLWRDQAGTLHCQSGICPHLGANIGYGGSVVADGVKCPFHGYVYDSGGRVCERLGEQGPASRRLILDTYRVEEHFGTIFVWNGRGEPDHAFPSDAILGSDTSEDDVDAYHMAFHLPFAGKPFAENVADGNHFGALHRAGTWGETIFLDESPTVLQQRLEVREPVRTFSRAYLRETACMGQLLNPSIATDAGMTMTTFGGGIHLVQVDQFSDPGTERRLRSRMLDFAGAVRAIVCWTPITANSHWHGVTFITPPLRVPVPDAVLRPVLEWVLAKRDWGATLQDCAVMYYRREQPNPPYGRLDRGLVRFRRFWDSRIEDPSLQAGDDVHSNGLRAGIRWEDRPPAEPEHVTIRSIGHPA